jgi:hypothetical protein
MNSSSCGNHCVLQQVRRLAIHNSSPLPEAWNVHGQDLVGRRQPVNPTLQFVCFRWVMMPCPLNARLHLTECHSGEKQPGLFDGVEPGDYCSVWAQFSQFRDYVRIEQVLIHSNSTTVRRRKLRLSGIRSSNRGSGTSNHSFRPGRAAFCSRSHSSIGTRTAVLIPRRVTTCGPFLMVASRNSLKRAFASCTCHEAIFHLSRYIIIIMTSHLTSLLKNKPLSVHLLPPSRGSHLLRSTGRGTEGPGSSY